MKTDKGRKDVIHKYGKRKKSKKELEINVIRMCKISVKEILNYSRGKQRLEQVSRTVKQEGSTSYVIITNIY